MGGWLQASNSIPLCLFPQSSHVGKNNTSVLGWAKSTNQWVLTHSAHRSPQRVLVRLLVINFGYPVGVQGHAPEFSIGAGRSGQ